MPVVLVTLIQLSTWHHAGDPIIIWRVFMCHDVVCLNAIDWWLLCGTAFQPFAPIHGRYIPQQQWIIPVEWCTIWQPKLPRIDLRSILVTTNKWTKSSIYGIWWACLFAAQDTSSTNIGEMSTLIQYLSRNFPTT